MGEGGGTCGEASSSESASVIVGRSSGEKERGGVRSGGDRR